MLPTNRFVGAFAGKTKTMGVRRGRRYCFDPYCFRGFADITCFYKDKLYFIEVKTKKGKQSPEQKQFQDACEEVGITYILARSFEDVREAIN